MGLFSLAYKNVPRRSVYAHGYLKFRADEESLSHFFAPILSYVSLNDLIGEAVFWCLLPSTLAIWTFPLVFYRSEFIIIAPALYVLARILNMTIYLKPLNYLVFIFANMLLQFIFYAILSVVFIFKGGTSEFSSSLIPVLMLCIVFLFFAFGGDEFIFGLIMLSLLFCYPFLKKFLFLPPSDQILWNVGQFYSKKFRINPTQMLRKHYPILTTKEYL